jgi:hypothetical protein
MIYKIEFLSRARKELLEAWDWYDDKDHCNKFYFPHQQKSEEEIYRGEIKTCLASSRSIGFGANFTSTLTIFPLSILFPYGWRPGPLKAKEGAIKH